MSSDQDRTRMHRTAFRWSSCIFFFIRIVCIDDDHRVCAVYGMGKKHNFTQSEYTRMYVYHRRYRGPSISSRVVLRPGNKRGTGCLHIWPPCVIIQFHLYGASHSRSVRGVVQGMYTSDYVQRQQRPGLPTWSGCASKRVSGLASD